MFIEAGSPFLPQLTGEPPGAPPGQAPRPCKCLQLCSPDLPNGLSGRQLVPLQIGAGCSVPRIQLSLHRVGVLREPCKSWGLKGSCC